MAPVHLNYCDNKNVRESLDFLDNVIASFDDGSSSCCSEAESEMSYLKPTANNVDVKASRIKSRLLDEPRSPMKTKINITVTPMNDSNKKPFVQRNTNNVNNKRNTTEVSDMKKKDSTTATRAIIDDESSANHLKSVKQQIKELEEQSHKMSLVNDDSIEKVEDVKKASSGGVKVLPNDLNRSGGSEVSPKRQKTTTRDASQGHEVKRRAPEVSRKQFSSKSGRQTSQTKRSTGNVAEKQNKDHGERYDVGNNSQDVNRKGDNKYRKASTSATTFVSRYDNVSKPDETVTKQNNQSKGRTDIERNHPLPQRKPKKEMITNKSKVPAREQSSSNRFKSRVADDLKLEDDSYPYEGSSSPVLPMSVGNGHQWSRSKTASNIVLSQNFKEKSAVRGRRQKMAVEDECDGDVITKDRHMVETSSKGRQVLPSPSNTKVSNLSHQGSRPCHSPPFASPLRGQSHHQQHRMKHRGQVTGDVSEKQPMVSDMQRNDVRIHSNVTKNLGQRQHSMFDLNRMSMNHQLHHRNQHPTTQAALMSGPIAPPHFNGGFVHTHLHPQPIPNFMHRAHPNAPQVYPLYSKKAHHHSSSSGGAGRDPKMGSRISKHTSALKGGANVKSSSSHISSAADAVKNKRDGRNVTHHQQSSKHQPKFTRSSTEGSIWFAKDSSDETSDGNARIAGLSRRRMILQNAMAKQNMMIKEQQSRRPSHQHSSPEDSERSSSGSETRVTKENKPMNLSSYSRPMIFQSTAAVATKASLISPYPPAVRQGFHPLWQNISPSHPISPPLFVEQKRAYPHHGQQEPYHCSDDKVMHGTKFRTSHSPSSNDSSSHGRPLHRDLSERSNAVSGRFRAGGPVKRHTSSAGILNYTKSRNKVTPNDEPISKKQSIPKKQEMFRKSGASDINSSSQPFQSLPWEEIILNDDPLIHQKISVDRSTSKMSHDSHWVLKERKAVGYGAQEFQHRDNSSVEKNGNLTKKYPSTYYLFSEEQHCATTSSTSSSSNSNKTNSRKSTSPFGIGILRDKFKKNPNVYLPTSGQVSRDNDRHQDNIKTRSTSSNVRSERQDGDREGRWGRSRSSFNERDTLESECSSVSSGIVGDHNRIEEGDDKMSTSRDSSLRSSVIDVIDDDDVDSDHRNRIHDSLGKGSSGNSSMSPHNSMEGSPQLFVKMKHEQSSKYSKDSKSLVDDQKQSQRISDVSGKMNKSRSSELHGNEGGGGTFKEMVENFHRNFNSNGDEEDDYEELTSAEDFRNLTSFNSARDDSNVRNLSPKKYEKDQSSCEDREKPRDNDEKGRNKTKPSRYCNVRSSMEDTLTSHNSMWSTTSSITPAANFDFKTSKAHEISRNVKNGSEKSDGRHIKGETNLVPSPKTSTANKEMIETSKSSNVHEDRVRIPAGAWKVMPHVPESSKLINLMNKSAITHAVELGDEIVELKSSRSRLNEESSSSSNNENHRNNKFQKPQMECDEKPLSASLDKRDNKKEKHKKNMKRPDVIHTGMEKSSKPLKRSSSHHETKQEVLLSSRLLNKYYNEDHESTVSSTKSSGYDASRTTDNHHTGGGGSHHSNKSGVPEKLQFAQFIADSTERKMTFNPFKGIWKKKHNYTLDST